MINIIINELNDYNQQTKQQQIAMDHNQYDHQYMKQNLDANILHNHQSSKSSIDKLSKPIKPFRQISNQQQTNLIKKTAYIVDSDQEQSTPQKYHSKQYKLNKSIDQVSQIIQSLSRDVSIPTSPKVIAQIQIATCQYHSQSIYSYNFCMQCSVYLLCPICIKSNHKSHMILTFNTQPQAKYLTKQFLIQKIEQTLQKLKSTQNNLKNKSSQMELIQSNVKRMQQEVMNKLQTVFREICSVVRNVYEKQQTIYEKRIDEFYRGYNMVGDQLRENLLTIIEQSFEIKEFNSSWISKQPPKVPDQQINKFKSTLQKTKKFYKFITDSLQQLKLKVIESSKLSNKTNSNKSNISLNNRKASTKKYQKFLTDSCYNDNEKQSKSSLIKILDTLSRC